MVGYKSRFSSVDVKFCFLLFHSEAANEHEQEKVQRQSSNRALIITANSSSLSTCRPTRRKKPFYSHRKCIYGGEEWAVFWATF